MDPIATVRSPLTFVEAITFLKHADDYQCISAPPVKPKAGVVLLFKAPSVDKEGMFVRLFQTFFMLETSLACMQELTISLFMYIAHRPKLGSCILPRHEWT